MNLSKLKVGTRLTLGFGVVCLLLVITIGVGLSKLATLDAGTHLIVGDKWPKLRKASMLLTSVDTIAISLRNMMLNANADDRKGQVSAIMASRQAGDATIDELQRAIKSEKGTAMLRAIVEHRARYREGQDKLLALIAAGDDEGAKAYLSNELRPVLGAYKEKLNILIDHEVRQIEETADAAVVTYEAARTLMLGLGAIAIALAAAIGYSITRRLLLQLGGEPDYASSIAAEIAAGNLGVQVAVRPGDTASMLYAMAAMREQLAKVVLEVRTSTDMIHTASSEIAAGNQELSARTEQQASALEETASSMEELTSTVRQNADNARQANQLAVSASDVASKGGAVVAQVVDTMQSINESSRSIVDIISVIDGIAFQTNILALNAAVEAARAGEQGRGFAVVASEVRTLAQRSASAAKEIKALIDNSVTKVDQGARLVDQAGVTMDAIIQSVRSVTDIMSEISAASAEQSAGIEQINMAVTQMDQVTQQNAALVEEAAAASAQMQDQAAGLTRAVSLFRLGATEQAPAALAPVRRAAPKPAPRMIAATAGAAGDWASF
ncbi:methyl-accepting chemotaxis protein [Massilia sp. GCM10020059]|uniref:methyl-accepting chemotaxis protein n=1 Tax=Massilia TaxID=149698 RepID=UPI0027D967AB|nr:methyl-accepting chemotaxis protein [Massilia agrisoli]